MRYSRGRIIALTILSVTMTLALFCTGFIIDFNHFLRAVNTDLFVEDPNYIPTFDDLYERIPFDDVDTGTVILGQKTKLTLLEERYDRDVLTNFLNADTKRAYSELQTRRKEGYPYPIFTNTEMQSIANELGNNLNIPVVMLDSSKYDDIVLFELTDLYDSPNQLMIYRDGILLDDTVVRPVAGNLSADYVYAGIPDRSLPSQSNTIQDENGNTLLYISFTPDPKVVDGYTVAVQSANMEFFYNMSFQEIKTIPNGTTTNLYSRDESAILMYKVRRTNNVVEIFDAQNKSLGKITYNIDEEKQLTNYEIGAVAYNGNALRGMFQEQGFYEISFKQNVSTGDGVVTQIDVSFAFIIVNKLYYSSSFPRFNTKNRVVGNSEIYNYSYESTYPEVNYTSYYFNVQIQTTAKYTNNDLGGGSVQLRFYNIGEYRMVSTLQFYSQFLARREQDYKNRGVTKGVVKLSRYTPYSSVLNIFGFQAYYGGQHTNAKYNGPLPFYDSEKSNVSSDISSWVRTKKMTAAESGAVRDYSNMRVSDALNYSTQLAKYITQEKLQPVRTNFPPVKLQGNVAHATGIGMNGEKNAILSSVAFKPASSMGKTSEWESKTMEVGAPFEEAGQYVVTVYFKVNDEVCQQTFFFEIVNAAKIAFDVTDAQGNTKTYYAGDLDLSAKEIISASHIKLNYDGTTVLGQFEVPPSITLAYAPFGVYDYEDIYLPVRDNGAFEFTLDPGQYRLTIQYGAHSKSSSVFSIVVDDTLATGIKANTSAQSLTNIADNIAIVGDGEVTLTWNQKASGINFNNVLCEFYEMELEKKDPNSDRNYFDPNDDTLAKVKWLYAAYGFSSRNAVPNNGYEPVKTETGWTLKETFSVAGLYRFTFIDDVGNQTQFLLIIDNSTPTFVQSGKKPVVTNEDGTESPRTTNAVNFDENEGVYIGFGTRKLLSGRGSNEQTANMLNGFSSALEKSGNLATEDHGSKDKLETSIAIGLAKIECSRSGAAYYELDKEDVENGYIVLKEEDTYYFRVTDVLGNIGEYYIILTHDNCFGMIYAETTQPLISSNGRGLVSETPGVYTSLVTSTGGMTNRNYVSFSFEQKNDKQDFNVQRVYLTYYPLTYQTTSSVNPGQANPNYPFSDRKVNNPLTDDGYAIFATGQDTDTDAHPGMIYTYNELDAGKTIRLALFNNGIKTPSGMYIITREYNRVVDQKVDDIYRDYYFIVDNQKMLYYGEDYQTALKVHFANQKELEYPQAKDADAAVFARYHNELSSNRLAYVSGFKSKYSWKHDSTAYNLISYNTIAMRENNPTLTTFNYSFPSLMPRFSYVHNNQTTYLGEGANSQPWTIGEPNSENTIYKLVVADNARSVSCMLINGNITELKTDPDAPTSANYDYLTLNLDIGYGTKAEIVVADDKVITTAGMQYDGESYIYVVDPSDIKQLKFRFESDPENDPSNESMFAKVDLGASVSSWTSVGFMQNVSFNIPTPDNRIYTFDLMENFLKGQEISNGSSLSVSLLTYDDTCTNYTILFDTREPSYNLARVRNGDNLARTLNVDELPGEYIYGLNSDFVFESDQNTNRYLEAKTITYREVDYSGEGTQPEVQFKLYTGAKGEERIPFATLVGLRDNEMKYYFITEIDYAGHSTSYKVQIQGKNYINGINFIGAITEEGAETQIGIEMHASSSSVIQFFMRNNSFKFESGDEYYTVLGSMASWHIGDNIGTGPKSEESLINALNTWINVATENGTKCSYTLYDRIGEVEVFEFYNIRDNAAKIQLDCYQVSATSSVIMAMVTNHDDLPKILFDDALASMFKMEVTDTTTGSTTEPYFLLQGTPIQSADVTHELIITVTDPFGRVSTTEYHQQLQSTINFTVYGNTVTKDGALYVGDERGVDFSYLRTVYNVLIYDAGTGELLTDLQSFISNDMIYYEFKPLRGATTIQQYRIVATGRASGAVLFDQTFIFDTRLPSVDWKNASDQSIEVEGQTFVSAVIIDISKSIVPTIFPVTISYTRTLDRHVERVTLPQNTTKYTFDRVGVYEVTLRNTVWAKKTYSFEIVQIDDTLVLVYDDGVQLEASSSDYKFTPNPNKPNEYTYIPRYVFTTTTKAGEDFHPVYDYAYHGLEIKEGQSNRVKAGNPEKGTDYYYYDEGNKTIVWRLAFLAGVDENGVPRYVNPLYFATTGVSTDRLNDGQLISLLLNGDPNGLRNGATPVVPSRTYDTIGNGFMNAHDDKVEVSLYCTTGQVDEFGAPYYMVEGNTILVDCYYNGKFVKTLTHSDVFTINRDDAGFYEFTVHDLVGNYLYFGSESAPKGSLNAETERYMLVVMTKPMVTINNKLPINGMVYNDKAELKLVDYGNDFLYKKDAEENEKYADFFTRLYCVKKIVVTYTGANGQTVEERYVNGTESSFYWSNSGYYDVKLTYRISNNALEDLEAEYQFQVISSLTIRRSFSMPIYPDIQVVSVKRNGYTIHDFDNLKAGDTMNFDADTNPGTYVITLRTYSVAMQDYVTHEVTFNIQDKANSASSYFVLSSGSGAATTNSVTLWYNPYWLYYMQGTVTITLEKDFVEQAVVVVNSQTLDETGDNSVELFTVSDAGLYTVTVYNAEDGIIHIESWTISEQTSTFGYVILAIVLAIAGIALLLFLRMRNKMTTK